MTSKSIGSRTPAMRSTAGFTLLELLGCLLLVGLLATAMIQKFPGILERGRDTKAVTLHDDLQSWYTQWVTAGAMHNATTSNEGQMAFFLINTVMSTEPTDTGIGKQPDADGNWADETRLMTGAGADRKSAAGAIRYQVLKPYVFDSATNTVLFDSQWEVTFHPTSNSSGEFIVKVRRD